MSNREQEKWLREGVAAERQARDLRIAGEHEFARASDLLGRVRVLCPELSEYWRRYDAEYERQEQEQRPPNPPAPAPGPG